NIIAIRANLPRPGWIQQKVSIRSQSDVFQTLFYLNLFLSMVGNQTFTIVKNQICCQKWLFEHRT
ncbi:hypothetical protein, partial [Salmonella enterica]|uniref:hypothetical protein n=1 Tax=Salmonella enterica TaxID=28901 RepID=UPI001BAF4F21